MKIKQLMGIGKGKYDDNDDPPRLSSVVESDDYFTVLGSVEVEVDFDMPSDIEIREMKISAINQEIEKVKANTEVLLERLSGDIQRLMAIESQIAEDAAAQSSSGRMSDAMRRSFY